MDETKPQTKIISFQAIIKHLQAEGWTQRQLAEWSGISHGRIGQLALSAAAEPRFNAGHALLSLLTPTAHIRLTGYARQYRGTTRVRPPLVER